VNLTHGPDAMRCLRERYARVRELAGSQQAASSSVETAEATVAHERHRRVLQRARERLAACAAAAVGDAVASQLSLSLQQFMAAQAACVRSARDMVAKICEHRLLAAAKTLTQQRQRPALAAACSALLTTDSTDGDSVGRSAEFTSLVLLLSPIVVATPADVAIWLSPPDSAAPLFSATIVDDAAKISPHQVRKMPSWPRSWTNFGLL
jgi:hypothetical protein